MTRMRLEQIKIQTKLDKIQNILFTELEEWFASNRLTINLDKTNFNIFHPPRKKMSQEFNNLLICSI